MLSRSRFCARVCALPFWFDGLFWLKIFRSCWPLRNILFRTFLAQHHRVRFSYTLPSQFSFAFRWITNTMHTPPYTQFAFPWHVWLHWGDKTHSHTAEGQYGQPKGRKENDPSSPSEKILDFDQQNLSAPPFYSRCIVQLLRARCLEKKVKRYIDHGAQFCTHTHTHMHVAVIEGSLCFHDLVVLYTRIQGDFASFDEHATRSRGTMKENM